LRVDVRPAAVESTSYDTCDVALLTTYAGPGGQLVHHLHFRLANWRKREASVVLPAGAKVLAARAEGHWLSPLPQKEVEEGVQVELPASEAAGPQNFEINYTTPAEFAMWKFWQTLTAQLPRLPARPLDLRQIWILPPGVTPLSEAWQRVHLPADVGPNWTQW